MSKVKLKKAQSMRTLREDGIWMYHDTVDPKDVEKSPEYFDEVATDLIDPEKYFTQPLTSGIGTRFSLILGDPTGNHYKADFEVDGLVKLVNEHGIATFRLIWSMCGDWKVVDMTERTKKTVRGEDRKQDDKKVA